MKKGLKKVLASILVVCMLLSMVACGKKPEKETSSDKKDKTKTETTKDKESNEKDVKEIDRSETITLDIFSATANYQGIATGWFAKIVKDKFNIELNIIAPNIAGGGDTLYQTRSAEGHLGDIISIDKAKMKDCIEAGIVLDITEYYNNSENLKQLDPSVKSFQDYAGTDRVYALVGGVSTESPLTPYFEAQAPYVGSFMRLDLYNQLGNPEMKTSADMLNVLKQMQEIHPTAANGKKTYAFSLWGDWDGSYMALASKFAFMYGYDESVSGFCFSSPDATSYNHLAQDGGVYHNALKLLFDANQMGLVDPDSSSQNWDSAWNKMGEGQTLFAFWPWHAGAFNTLENKNQGMGMMYIPVGDQVMVNAGHNIYGQNAAIAIGAKTKYPERVLEFIEWFATPEYNNYGEAGGGIQGVTWDIVDGRPVLTELGKLVTQDEDALMPEEVGGGTFKAGCNNMHLGFITGLAINPETGEPFSRTEWSSVIEDNMSKVEELYEEIFGAKTAAEYLTKNNLVTVVPGSNYTAPQDDSELAIKRTQCGELITQTSWRMVFAKNESEFNTLWENMKSQLEGFGYEDVLAVDIAKVEGLREARAKAVADFQ